MDSHNNSKELRVGIVSFIAIILLALGIALGRGWSSSATGIPITMKFPSSGGITSGEPITINGVKRGIVVDVKPIDNYVIITGSIDNISDLKKDASANVGMLEITGGKKIEIIPGTSAENLSSGAIIPGKALADISELMGMLGEIGRDAKTTLKRIDTTIAAINLIVGDSAFPGKVNRIINNLDALSGSANALISDNKATLQETIKDLRIIASDVKSAVKTNSPKIEPLLTRLDSTLSIAHRTIANADGTIHKADQLVVDINSLVNDIRSTQGLVHRLIYDKSLALRIDSTLTIARQFLEKIDQHGVNVNLRLGTRP